jgi:putative sigma-54 modulation protein
MDIHLTTRHLPRQTDLVGFAQRRAAFAFSRFGELVRQVDIRLSDVNGPRGGVGITCLARLRLVRGGDLLVEGSARSPEDGIASSMARLASRLRRLVSRHRDHR